MKFTHRLINAWSELPASPRGSDAARSPLIAKQMAKCEPLDQGHLKEVKQYQNRLRNALRQVMRFCPDTSTREVSNMQFMVDLNIDKELNDLILYDCRCAPR